MYQASIVIYTMQLRILKESHEAVKNTCVQFIQSSFHLDALHGEYTQCHSDDTIKSFKAGSTFRAAHKRRDLRRREPM